MRSRFLVSAAFPGKGHAAFHSHFGSAVRAGLAGLAFAATLGTAPVAGAGILTLGLGIEFSGAQTPEGTPPFITASFDDSFGGPNTVRLTISAGGLVDAETMGNIFFNFDPALDPTQLSFVAVNTGAVGTTAIDTGVDAFRAAGDGFFDILFDFPPPPGTNAALFSAGETVVYDITYTGPIDALSFNFFSASGPGSSPGPFLSAAHIQRIGPQNNGSGWIGAVPEPSTALLFGLGLMGLAVGGRRRR